MPAEAPRSPKERAPDPSLDSERESQATHARRVARETRGARRPPDLREDED